jgi:hypothetical protein
VIKTSICENIKEGYHEPIWAFLCLGSFEETVNHVIQRGEDITIVQIGAHTGYEKNDPLAIGLTSMIYELGSTMHDKVHWTFVEPSPPNYERLVKNLANHSDVCDMHSVNAGVVPDDVVDTTGVVFYSIRDTIDPETGFDSLSGKTLPPWITQVSSFTKDPIMFNRGVFRRNGLTVLDYIVETNVTVKRYSDLMKEVVGKDPHVPLLVLIDTEGFDCNIVNGISSASPFLPRYLVFEHKQCTRDALKQVWEHLEFMQYNVTKATDGDNVVAVRTKQ